MPGTFDGRLAFASILFAGPGAPAFRTQSGDFASVAVVGGVTRLTFQDPIAPYQGFPSLTLRSATGGYASVVDWTGTYLDIETLDTTGAAAEIEFDLTIVQQTVAFATPAPPPPPPPPPSPPLDSLGAWWRADDAGTIEGANVTSWTDRSAFAQTLTTVGGVNAPIFRASIPSLNNRPAVEFSPNSGLRLSLPPGFSAGASAVTAYIVLEIDAFGGGELPFCYGVVSPGAPGDHFAFFVVGGPSRAGTDIYFGGAFAPTSGAAKILASRSAAGAQWGNSILTFDGAAPAGIAYANPTTVLNIPSPVAAVSVGGVQGAWTFQGRIAEVLYYSKDQTFAERADTLIYLSDRYGIPIP